MKASKVKCPFFYFEQGVERCTLFEINEQLQNYNIYKRDNCWFEGFMSLPSCPFVSNAQQAEFCPKRPLYKEEISTQRLENRSL